MENHIQVGGVTQTYRRNDLDINSLHVIVQM